MNNSLKDKLYDNCSVYSPCGKLMFRCKEKRINWYLKRELAELIEVEGEGLCAKLLFEPKGLGKHNDPFSLEKAENKCVVCGKESNLTRHHVIPSMYRKHFPNKYKSNYHHDVLPICRTCHDEYELTADTLKGELADRFNVRTDYKEYFSISRVAYDYKFYREFMSEDKLETSIQRMDDFIGGNSLENIEKLISLKGVASDMIRNQGRRVIENFDLQEFVELWRSHFIENSDPKFMSEHWSINRSIEKN